MALLALISDICFFSCTPFIPRLYHFGHGFIPELYQNYTAFIRDEIRRVLGRPDHFNIMIYRIYMYLKSIRCEFYARTFDLPTNSIVSARRLCVNMSHNLFEGGRLAESYFHV